MSPARGRPTGSAPQEEPAHPTRQQMERREEERLAPYALKSARSRRRIALDAEGRVFDYRTEFQRDRDRIIHSRAFRRLRDKSHTDLAGDGDHYRSLLTHALEVSQLGRTMAQALRLNADLVEAIALGHDLGSPPLGSGGVEILDSLLSGGVAIEGFTARALRELGGFQVPAQTLKVVDLLEKRYDHPGINLTDDCRSGLWKLGEAEEESAPSEGLAPGAPPSAEAQAVRLACRIAARTQELDDLLRARPELLERFERLGLLRELKRKLGRRYSRARGHFMKLNVVHRGLTHLLVTDGILHAEAALGHWARREKIDSTERYYQRKGALPPSVVGLSEPVEALLGEMEPALDAALAASRGTVRGRHRAGRILGGLFRAYYKSPAVLDDYLLLRFREAERIRFLRDVPPDETEREVAKHYRGSPGLVRMIGDHLAGMTDSYAAAEYRQLCTA